MFEKILLVYSEKLSDKHVKTVDKVKAIIGECKTIRADNLREEHLQNIDLVITVGGDGAFIRAASFIQKQIILGINSEPEYSEGGLLTLKENELEKLTDILKGNYKLQERERIQIIRNNHPVRELALNEVYIGTLNQFDTSRYIIRFKGQEEEHRSSGVLIATNSGSSAWYKSAGGVPFNQRGSLRFLIREPFIARLFNPKILHGEIKSGENIQFEGRRHIGGIVAIDSNKTYDFNMNDKIELILSSSPLNVIAK